MAADGCSSLSSTMLASPTKEHEKKEAAEKYIAMEPEKQENVEEEARTVKEETIDDGDYSFDGSDSRFACSPSSPTMVPKPMEGLSESSPPPFLNKIFQMVENPSTDAIISWSVPKDSFIVWDHHEFSLTILPKYFKHSNYSSFIRQLNTYGFRKINTDRWEFAHPEFQGGKKHLLTNIKRRSRTNYNCQRDVMKLGVETELETIKEDNDMARTEILKLREDQESSVLDIMDAEERLKKTEIKQQQMLYFLAKAATNPELVQQLIQKRRKQEGHLNGGELYKRRRLHAADHSSFADTSSRHHDHIQETEPTSEMGQEMQTMFSTSIKQDPGGHENTLIVKDVGGKDLASNYSKIFLELENLIEANGFGHTC